MKPFFSVVIPLFNKENFIAATLSSVLRQNFEDYEIIIIDDSSNDNSLKIVETFEDDRIKIIIHNKNKGLSATRNTGIANSKGDWICLLDADDIWNCNYLKKIVELINLFPAAKIIGTDYYEIHSNNNKLLPKHSINNRLKKSSFLVEDIFAANMGQPLLCQSSIVFHKSITKNRSIFNEEITFGEDIDFYIRYFSKYKVAYCYSPLVSIQLNDPNQITKSGISKKTIPQFSSYKNDINSKSLEKYLDFQKYTFVLNYRKEKTFEDANKLQKTINFKNLNIKQKVLIKLPYVILKSIDIIKRKLLSKNIRVSSY